VTSAPPLSGGIIAAGEGSRLRRAGFPVPKPMVCVAGVPLLESVIRNFIAAGISRISIIVNECERDCVEWASARFPDLTFDWTVKTTASSLESFAVVAGGPAAGRMLISTVDAWCRPQDFAGFVEAARRRPEEATVLGLTPLVADEKPLGVSVDTRGRITALGVPTPVLVTAGMYLVSAGAAARLRGAVRAAAGLSGLAAQGRRADVRRDDRDRGGRGPSRGRGPGRVAGGPSLVSR